jgi:hypothetical protein
MKFEDTFSAKGKKQEWDNESIEDDELMNLGDDSGKPKAPIFGERNAKGSVLATFSGSSSSSTSALKNK